MNHSIFFSFERLYYSVKRAKVKLLNCTQLIYLILKIDSSILINVKFGYHNVRNINE